MTHGRTIPRAAIGGTLALAALLVLTAARTGRADEEEQQPPGKGRFGGFPGKGGPPGKGGIEQAEKELQRKLEEVEALKKRIAEAKKAAATKGGTVRVEINGASKEEVERATAALKKALPGKDVKVTAPAAATEEKRPTGFPGWGGGWGKKDFKGPKGDWTPPKSEAKKEAPTPTADRRIDGLERKLEAVIRELEALRKEMKGGPPDKKRGPRFEE